MRDEQRDWRQAALAAVVVALMAVSISGQVQAIQERLGFPFAVAFAVAHDAAAILALEAGLKAAQGSSIRKWAWTAILMAAGTGGLLNVWHVTVQPIEKAGAELPPELLTAFGLLLGLEPIALILVLSHLVGLVLAEARQSRQPANATTASRDRQDRHTATASRTASDRQPDRQETHVVIASRPPVDRQWTATPTASATARATAQTARTATASTATPPALPAASTASRDRQLDRQQPRQVSAAARPAGPQASARVDFPGPRQTWMTPALLNAVLQSMRQAQAEKKSYGRPTLMREHGLTKHRAIAIADFIKEHDLLRASA